MLLLKFPVNLHRNIDDDGLVVHGKRKVEVVMAGTFLVQIMSEHRELLNR